MHLVQIHQGGATTVILLGDANRQEERQFTAQVLLNYEKHIGNMCFTCAARGSTEVCVVWHF